MPPAISEDPERDTFTIPKFKDNISTEEATSLLKAELRKYENHVAALKTRLNGFAPISCLPLELLCKILEMTKNFDNPRQGSIRWIKLSHVCHTWRSLMVHTPFFWTTLPITRPRWAKEMILRSKGASLTVLVNLFYSYSPAKPDLSTALSALQLISRIQDLEITGRSQHAEHLQQLLDSIPESAPRLRDLSIGFSDSVLESRQSRSHVGNIVLSSRSLCDMERLCSLNVNSCGIDWDIHLANMPKLTSLTINNAAISTGPTATAFWNALRNMHALQHLHLSGTLPILPSSALHSDNSKREKVHLPKLLDLNLQDNADRVAAFLNGVVLLPDARLDITCQGSDASSFINASCALSSTIKSDIVSLVVRQKDMCCYQLGVYYSLQESQEPTPWQTTHVYRNPEEDDSAKCDVRLSFIAQRSQSGDELSMDGLWTSLFTGLSLFEVSEITLHLGGYRSSSAIASTLGVLPKLKTLIVKDAHASNVLNALEEGSTTGPAVFPVLSTLKLSSESFRRSANKWSLVPCTYTTLLDCLTYRRKHRKSPINNLTLSGYFPNLTGERIVALQAVVDHVEYQVSPYEYDCDDSEYDSYDSDAYHHHTSYAYGYYSDY